MQLHHQKPTPTLTMTQESCIHGAREQDLQVALQVGESTLCIPLVNFPSPTVVYCSYNCEEVPCSFNKPRSVPLHPFWREYFNSKETNSQQWPSTCLPLET